jgi:hypothetical protein
VKEVESEKMMRRLGRLALRALLAIAVISLATFIVDLAVFKLRGSPHSTVAVSQFMEIPLKSGLPEYDYVGTANVPCAEALFPQGGQDPCWHLRRNQTQWVKLGTPAY